MPNNLTTREKQMLQALKIAQSEMRAYGGSIGAVDSIIKVVEAPQHVFQAADQYWGLETCLSCGRPSWDKQHVQEPVQPHTFKRKPYTGGACSLCPLPIEDPVHITKPRRWLVEQCAGTSVGGPSDSHVRLSEGGTTPTMVICEVKPITRGRVYAAFDKTAGSIGRDVETLPSFYMVEFLRLLGIQIED